MQRLVFATNNVHKLEEVRFILRAAGIEILSLADIGCHEDIPETADTLSGNALQKAGFVHQRYSCDCFADDTGLEVDALNGAPGVYSARYAGEGKSFDDNINKLLFELRNHNNRRARFKTVIALILQGKEYLFEGSVEGSILSVRKGSSGFGYDPVFLPSGHSRTFAEMSAQEKNALSHRFIATDELRKFLENQ